MAFRIIIAGAGISGLAAGHRLIEAGDDRLDIHLFEASSRTGGLLHTVEQDGFLLELGPDSFLASKPWLMDLCRRIGMADRVISTSSLHRRSHIVFRGRLHPLPEGFLLMAPTRFWPLVTTPLFTWRGKLRMGLDLLLPRGNPEREESLGGFVTRRLGREALERVVQPLVGGIYTADPDDLSLNATLPRFLEMEKRYRSIIYAMWRQRRVSNQRKADSGVRYSEMVSFDRGMQTVADRLVERVLPERIHLNRKIRSVRRQERGWLVIPEHGPSCFADAVILALPAHQSAALLRETAPDVARELMNIPHASSAALNMAYRREHIPHPMDTFGFVVPATEGRSIIACSFSSVKFPGRAPDGDALLRVFIGGAMQSHLFDLDDTDLIRMARAELQDLLGVTAAPLFTRLSRYPNAMPQYHLGHLARIERIETLMANYSGLYLSGPAFQGVGVPDSVRSGETAAERILNALPG